MQITLHLVLDGRRMFRTFKSETVARQAREAMAKRGVKATLTITMEPSDAPRPVPDHVAQRSVDGALPLTAPAPGHTFKRFGQEKLPPIRSVLAEPAAGPSDLMPIVALDLGGAGSEHGACLLGEADLHAIDLTPLEPHCSSFQRIVSDRIREHVATVQHAGQDVVVAIYWRAPRGLTPGRVWVGTPGNQPADMKEVRTWRRCHVNQIVKEALAQLKQLPLVPAI